MSRVLASRVAALPLASLGVVTDSCLSVVSEPDKSRAVFVHALDECPPVRLPEYVLSRILNHRRPANDVIIAHSGTTMQMQKGQVVLTPYAVVEQLLGMGSVELI